MVKVVAGETPPASDMVRSRDPLSRFEHLLPLPAPCFDKSGSFLGASRRSSQRLSRGGAIASVVREIVFSINSLGGFPDSSAWPPAVFHSSQDDALRRIHLLHDQLAPSAEDKSDEATVCALLKTGGCGYFDTSPGRLARYDTGTVSLPCDQVQTCDPPPWVSGPCTWIRLVPVTSPCTRSSSTASGGRASSGSISSQGT